MSLVGAGILYSSRVRRRDLLPGRFIGAIVFSTVPMLGVSLAILLGPILPWSDRAQWGPVSWQAHASGILLFAIPNALVTGAEHRAITRGQPRLHA